MSTISEKQWTSLTQAVLREVREVAPEWSDHEAHDPGTTLVELLAFLSESLSSRTVSVDERYLAAVSRLARAAAVLAPSDAGTAPRALRRVNYFVGQLLSADDLTAEQSYFRGRLRRRNLALHGAGVVSGLKVSIVRGGGKKADQLRLEPGLAFDGRGEEIEVCEPQTEGLPAKGKTLHLLLRYSEQPCDPIPAFGQAQPSDAEGATRPSRIAETFGLSLEPQADDASLALARVRFKRGRWQLDRRFEVRRVRS